ncbi:hypothetical protein BDN67DRAFT_587488 [Paxillus ammoniavirescens]|nr:hypothetical protein BDN67DRAFT_587488 [Paxillus ammoniavirescens]
MWFRQALSPRPRLGRVVILVSPLRMQSQEFSSQKVIVTSILQRCMMFFHDGLRITLPKRPATAQIFGQPLLIASSHVLKVVANILVAQA